jgi:hypothetical protein
MLRLAGTQLDARVVGALVGVVGDGLSAAA